MRVASLPWLLHHELRLWWRDVRSRPGVLIVAVVLGGFFTLLFAIVWLALLQVRQASRQVDFSGQQQEAVFWLTVFLWLLAVCFGFIQSMGHSIHALFDRGDLDLLIASPISSKVVFASRLIGVALRVFLSYCPFVVPISLLIVAFGFPQILGIYPSLAAICLTTASLAMLMMMWLVRWLGARRARTAAQILTASLSALFFLATQIPNLLGAQSSSRVVASQWQQWFQADGIFGSDSLLWFPVRAVYFDLGAIVLTLLVAAGLVWLTVETLHRSFLQSSQQPTTESRRSGHIQETRFSQGFNQIVLLKEWRIILRNPYLISATFLQILFLMPALLVLARGGSDRFGISLGTIATVASITVGESLTQALTRICVSAEESPDLLKSSPIAGTVLRRLKLLAALIPVWVLMLPLFLLLLLRGELGLATIPVFLSSTTCAAVLRLWNSQPIRLSDITSRGQLNQGDILLSILETLSLFSWAWLGFALTQSHFLAAVFPLVLISLIVAGSYWRSRQLGTSLGF